jgi:uncharacterized repeat protein (TIGR01451 family)
LLVPSSLNFGDQLEDTTSAPRTVTIRNSGTAPLQIRNIAVRDGNRADFTVASPNLPVTLVPGADATLTVTFRPRAAGARTANLTVVDNAANSPQVVPMTGNGTPGANVRVRTSANVDRLGRVRFRVRIDNLGPEVARNVRLTDQLPANAGLVEGFTISPPEMIGGCDVPDVNSRGETLVCSFGDLPPSGVSSTVILDFRVAGAPAGEAVTNTATVLSDNDPKPANNSDTATVTP